ncbi:MAG: hypothetical protein IPK07_08730 [Deltaproteobacteria bacterium]|nr:hypothetical protein [Deltaproteobacteria bacterium]
MTEARALMRHGRGRILAIRPGYNPNSSSLGVDLTLMLLGSATLSILITLVSTFVRLRLLAARDQLAPAGGASVDSPSDPDPTP